MSDRLTTNISRHELQCRCGCGYDSMDFETISVIQDCCDYFAQVLGIDKVVLRISSAARCALHNRAVGGAINSQHLAARAMDINILGVSPQDVFNYLDKKYPGEYGLGLYVRFVHFDTRTDGPARWGND